MAGQGAWDSGIAAEQLAGVFSRPLLHEPLHRTPWSLQAPELCVGVVGLW
jgi:hypothetical protein